MFEPERFLEGTAAAALRPAHGWIPFGDGGRGCPGAKFGAEEAVLTLVCARGRQVRVCMCRTACMVATTCTSGQSCAVLSGLFCRHGFRAQIHKPSPSLSLLKFCLTRLRTRLLTSLELKGFMAQVRLYQRFTFDVVPGQEPLQLHNTITISPECGLHVHVVPRSAPA